MSAPRSVGARALTLTVHLLGVVAFVYPFLLGGARGGEGGAHAADAPYLFTVLGTLLIAVAIAEVQGGRLDARRTALLGLLAGVNAVLRLPGSFAGANLMFVLPILCGAAFGARFAFLVGATSMAASAAITAGVGPWLPFQMWALGWLGAGGAIVRPLLARDRMRAAVAALAAYGWIAGMAFGALTNLWFWPFQAGASSVAWMPGIGLGQTLVRYWRFYVLTSLAWDSARALANVVLIAALGAPVVRLLIRFRARLEVRWAGPASAALE